MQLQFGQIFFLLFCFDFMPKHATIYDEFHPACPAGLKKAMYQTGAVIRSTASKKGDRAYMEARGFSTKKKRGFVSQSVLFGLSFFFLFATTAYLGFANLDQRLEKEETQKITACENAVGLDSFEKMHCISVLSAHNAEWEKQVKTGDSPY